MGFLLACVRIGFVAGALGVTAMAILALLGFAVPVFDLFNHVQPMIFVGTLAALLLGPLLFGGAGRRLLLALTATGFVASAVVVVPPFVLTLLPRTPPPADGRPVVTIMTHNIFGMNYDMDRVARVIAEEQPDIIALQEYFFEQERDLDPLLAANYPYRARCQGGKRANLGLYSKIPFTQVEDGECPQDAFGLARTAHILAQFTLADGAQFSVVSTHLDWPAPNIARQKEQFAALGQLVRDTPGPMIVVGDFNSTPWSYALRNFVHQAGLTHQSHGLFTFPLRFFYRGEWAIPFPFLPLDQVMSAGAVKVHDLHTSESTNSDHLPVVFQFSLDSASEHENASPLSVSE